MLSAGICIIDNLNKNINSTKVTSNAVNKRQGFYNIQISKPL